MTVFEFWTLIGMFVTIFLTLIGGVFTIVRRQDKMKDEISRDLRQFDNRLSRMEGFLEGCGVFGNKTGTEK